MNLYFIFIRDAFFSIAFTYSYFSVHDYFILIYIINCKSVYVNLKLCEEY